MTLRVRALSPTGDYTFGRPGFSGFLIDSAGAVQQKIETRLGLSQGEFFLDDLAGTPWMQQILGRHSAGPPRPPEKNTQMLYDLAIKSVILNTKGVSEIVSYSSNLDAKARSLVVNAQIQTIFSASPVTINTSAPLSGSTGLG